MASACRRALTGHVGSSRIEDKTQAVPRLPLAHLAVPLQSIENGHDHVFGHPDPPLPEFDLSRT